MTPTSILHHCRMLGIRLLVKDDHLQIQTIKGAVSADLLSAIRENKTGLIQLITSSEPSVSCVPDETDDGLQEAYEERAAIMEYDGGLSRSEAEKEAYRLIRANNRLREDGSIWIHGNP